MMSSWYKSLRWIEVISAPGPLALPRILLASIDAIKNAFIHINNIITEILCETTGKCELPKSNCGCGCGGAGKCGDK